MDDEFKVSGRSFQTRGSETAKLLDPYVIVLILGNIQHRSVLLIFPLILQTTITDQMLSIFEDGNLPVT